MCEFGLAVGSHGWLSAVDHIQFAQRCRGLIGTAGDEEMLRLFVGDYTIYCRYY